MELLGDMGHLESHLGPFLTRPMVLLGDKAELEAYFGPFGDSAYLDAR
jgi:hypothetical protein